MPAIIDLVFYVWASFSVLIFVVSTYKVAYKTTQAIEGVKEIKLDEAKKGWSSSHYQNRAYFWKMARWYLTWGLAPFAIALLWLPALPAFFGHNVASNEKKEKAALEEGMEILQSYYAKAEIEAASASGREPLLNLDGVLPELLRKSA